MRSLILLSVLLLASSCHLKPQGVLEVYENLTFKRKSIVRSRKTVSVYPGKWNASLKFKSSKVILDIDGKKKIKFKVPGRLSPGSNSIYLSSNQNGQPYDVKGNVDTDVRRSENINTSEACSYTEPYKDWECGYDRGYGRRRGCYPVTRYQTVYGERDVSYYMKYTDRDFFVDLLEEGRKVAYFQGEYNTKEKVYTYKGECY